MNRSDPISLCDERLADWARTHKLIEKIRTIEETSAGTALVLLVVGELEIVPLSDFQLSNRTAGGLIKAVLLETYAARAEELRARLRADHKVTPERLVEYAEAFGIQDIGAAVPEWRDRLPATVDRYCLAQS